MDRIYPTVRRGEPKKTLSGMIDGMMEEGEDIFLLIVKRDI